MASISRSTAPRGRDKLNRGSSGRRLSATLDALRRVNGRRPNKGRGGGDCITRPGPDASFLVSVATHPSHGEAELRIAPVTEQHKDAARAS
jgi:hypothetical protein